MKTITIEQLIKLLQNIKPAETGRSRDDLMNLPCYIYLDTGYRTAFEGAEEILEKDGVCIEPATDKLPERLLIVKR